MRATLQFARETAANGGRQALIAAEDTRNILTDIIAPIYIAGLVLPLPLGWVGEILNLLLVGLGYWTGWLWPAQFAAWANFTRLGNVPALLAFILVGYYFWVIEARIITAEAAVHALPDWLQRWVAKWSTKEGVLKHNFWLVSTIGLWAPTLLWIPALFPVWRSPANYLGGVACAMAITYFVATMEASARVWRKRYGWFLVPVLGYYVLGLMGYKMKSLLGYLTSTGISFDLSDETAIFRMGVLLIMGAVLIGGSIAMIRELFAPKTATKSSH